jgi:hypothetical protein
MAALDLTSFDAALKQYYTDEAVKNLVYTGRPFLGMLKKNTKVGGKTFEVPITIGSPNGRSKTFASAQSFKTASVHKRFSMTRAKNYGLADIDGETLDASIGNRNAFMEAATSEIDLTLNNLSNDLANDLFGDGTGLRGVVSGAPAGAVVTLSRIDDIHAFEVGMTLEHVDAANGVGGVLSGTNPNPTVTAVDRTLGKVTLSSATGIASGDFLFQAGDASNNGARPAKGTGLQGWLPNTVTATAFFGVDRTVDPVRLAGVKYDAATPGDDTEEALVNAGARLFTEGGRPDVVLVHPKRLAILDRLLEQRGRYDKVQSSDADIGFEAIVVHTGGGTVKVVADPWCELNDGFMLQKDTWTLFSIGNAPKILMQDGNRMLRNSSSDSVEVRAGYYANLACSAPGYNCRITFGAT